MLVITGRPPRGREESRFWSAKLGRADAEFVKAKTGFSIGGVSPLAHAQAPVTLIDAELFAEEIWAAAGHPHGVAQAPAQDLAYLADNAPTADVTQVVQP